MRDKLATPKIGSRGEVIEWQSDQPKMWEKEHRHSSHLVGLFPGRQITPYGTPDLAKAAAVSLKNRGVGITGWSKIHKAALYTRLFNADEAMMLVKEFVKINIWPSGLSAIKDGSGSGDKFQIDANLGVTAVIYEMLLQSHAGELHLLPALPAEIPKGSVQGIRGRGGFLCDLTWDNGKLTQAVIHSTLGGSCKVRYGDKVVRLDIKAGGSVVLDQDLTVVK
jgi:alpha-L-fucosidase 2